MKHLELENPDCRGILKRGKPYSICIGAGICNSIMPDWKELTFEVLKETVNPSLTNAEFDTLYNNLGWSLDSILQGSLNYVQENGGNIDTFNELIQQKLYSKITNNAARFNLDSKLHRFISDPFQRNSSDIIEIYNFFNNEYGNSSLFQLSKFLIESRENGNPPIAIITFNADVLLHSLLTLIQLKDTFDKTGKTNSADFYYKAVHHIIESDGHKIPIFHVHGSIVPFSGKRDARQNLVFQETSYHEVSGSTHSWQQIIFQYYALRNRIIFIGLSMSDPNIRRWLAHVHSVLNKDILHLTGKEEKSASHIWITPKSISVTEQEFKKLGLYHLGVKVGEIENWTKLYSGLSNLIS
jgi:hypothetical protein